MNIILLLASIIGTALGILILIFALVLIDTAIDYLRAKTDLINRQIEEYDFSYPHESNNTK